MEHKLKLLEIYFNLVVNKEMTFQIRKNDRNFKRKDILVLQEWINEEEGYTGREIKAEVLYVTNLHMEIDYVCMGIKILS